MTRRPLPDQAARDAIERELDINLLVEAGAGSGKTHSLARRMAAGIASGKYDVEHIAAVTFTRKAAAELRSRFQQALEEKLLDGVAEAVIPVVPAFRRAEGVAEAVTQAAGPVGVPPPPAHRPL